MTSELPLKSVPMLAQEILDGVAEEYDIPRESLLGNGRRGRMGIDQWTARARRDAIGRLHGLGLGRSEIIRITGLAESTVYVTLRRAKL